MFSSLLPIVQRASAAILEHYRKVEISVSNKDDGSPLTAADLASHEIITRALPGLGGPRHVLSEEGLVTFEERSGWGAFWIVDPLDGTKDFLARNDEFTINVGIILDTAALLGMVVAPALGVGYFAEKGRGAFKFDLQSGNSVRIRNERRGRDQLIGVQSRFHSLPAEDEIFAQYQVTTIRRVGSALKFCQIAEGLCDLYPRCENSKEWDTAAGQCILEEANCAIISSATGAALKYNKADLRNGPFIAARRDIFL